MGLSQGLEMTVNLDGYLPFHLDSFMANGTWRSVFGKVCGKAFCVSCIVFLQSIAIRLCQQRVVTGGHRDWRHM